MGTICSTVSLSSAGYNLSKSVNAYDVLLQGADLSEGRKTHVAYVRLVARMCKLVFFQVAQVAERPLTELADVRSFAAVDAPVPLQSSVSPEHLLAYATFVRFISCMCAPMVV